MVEEAAGVFLVEDLSDLAEAGAPEVRHGPFPDAISALNWLAEQVDGSCSCKP